MTESSPAEPRRGMGRAALGASAGTLVSRILGFVRNLALTAAIGTGLIADSFNVADNLPNILFLLVGGGTIAAVFVPQLVKHASVSSERVEEYGTVLIIISVVAGAIITGLSVLLGPALLGVLGGSSWAEPQSRLALAFLVWCAPQIFFLAVYWVVAQILNARGKFSSVSWLPSTSSIVVIAGCVALVMLGGVAPDAVADVDGTTILLLGGTTTLGAAVQTVALMIVLRRQGFRMRLPASLRGLALRATARTGIWVAAATAIYQLANVIAVAVTARAGAEAQRLGSSGRGYTAYFYGQTLVGVVSAIAVASLVTVLLQRLSHHNAAGDHSAANADLDVATLRVAAITIPVTGLFLCLGPVIAQILFTRGSTDAGAAQVIGIALALSSVSLFPNALHKIMLRPFFARSEGFRPFVSAVTISAVGSALVVASALLLAPQYVLFGVAAAYPIGFLIEMPFKARRLRRLGFRLRRDTVINIVRISGIALAIAGLVALFYWAARPWTESSPLAGWIFAAVASLVFLGLYVLATRRSPASLVALVRWLRH